ncbi:MAG TPA: hypothetical protein VEJ38_01760 [Candidatus Acidoferrales bacterium]|nr:hypothetical protein [Candidatus Acidoferrales bacterium]
MTKQGGVFAGWISGLADPDPGTRKVAAQRLYMAGAALCNSALNEWLDDTDFRALALPAGANGRPGPEGVSYTVGIAVEPGNFEKIRAANGSPRLSDVPPDQDAKEFELSFDGSRHFDILTTREPAGTGAIARYLQKFGEGIQQIEINVSDVDRASEILHTRFGLAPIYPQTRPGADNTRVNFFLVPTRNGGKVLIELVESPANQEERTRLA